MDMDNYYKLELLLGSCTEIFQDLFHVRWRASQGIDWSNSRSSGNKLVQILGRQFLKNSQPIQKQMIESGDVNAWDITLLSMLLRKCNFSGYQSPEIIVDENKAIEDTTKIRNTLAHLPTKTLTDDQFQQHMKNVRRILEILHVSQDQIGDMCEDACKGAIYSERRAFLLKGEGNAFYADGRYHEASEMYTRALNVLKTASDDVLGTLYSNRAQAYLKTVSKQMSLSEKDRFYKLALDDSLNSIKYRSSWCKPFVRAAEAYKGLCKWKKAVEMYERSTVLNPSMREELRSPLEFCKVMANIRLIADPDDDEGLPISFDERIKQWNDDPNGDGIMTRRRWMAMEAFGDGPAYTMLGHRYRNGWDVKQDLNEAMRCYCKAWKKEDPEGAYNLARMKYRGQVSEPDPRRGLKLLKSAAAMPKFDWYSIHWVSVSQFALGSIYDRGIYVEQDYSLAAKWYKEAAEGCDRAAFALGQMYSSGTGVPLNFKLSTKYWKIAAKKGNPNAKLRLCMNSLIDEEIHNINEDYLQSLRTAGLLDCYIQYAGDAIERNIEIAQKIEKKPILRSECLSAKSDKYNNLELLPYVPISSFARSIIDAKLKLTEFVTLLSNANGTLPMQCIDLYYDAYQPDVEFVHYYSPPTEFLIYCKELLCRGDLEPVMDKKVRFCIAHATKDNKAVAIWLEESIKIHPTEHLFQTFLSNIYGFFGKHQEGLKLAENVLKKSPTNLDALFCRATHLRKLDENTGTRLNPKTVNALKDFLEQADEDNRKRPEFLYTLALMYFQSGGEIGRERFLFYYKAGKTAETKLLPCFQPYENNIKWYADMYANMIDLSDILPISV